MTLRCKLMLVAGVVAWGSNAWSAPADNPPKLMYSQDGRHYNAFTPVEGTRKAARYYDYYDFSGHPEFGTEHGTSTAALYWDDKRSALSLILISGAPSTAGREGDSGHVRYDLEGLPAVARLALADEPREFTYRKGSPTAVADLVYTHATDGLVFGGLQKAGSFEISIDLDSLDGAQEWRLIDGGGDVIELDLDRPLYLRTGVPKKDRRKPRTPEVPPIVPPATGGSDPGTPTNPPAVPEPAAGLLIVAASGLLTRRRTR